jgi:hypothetical protein
LASLLVRAEPKRSVKAAISGAETIRALVPALRSRGDARGAGMVPRV